MNTAPLPPALSAYLTTDDAAKRLGRTRRLIQVLCCRGAFPGAIRIGRDWFIPKAQVTARKRLQAEGKDGKTRLPKGGRGVRAYAV